MENQNLSLSADDSVNLQEQFGQMQKRMAGIGGTLHITDENGLVSVPPLAWQLSKQTQKPVVVVIRATP